MFVPDYVLVSSYTDSQDNIFSSGIISAVGVYCVSTVCYWHCPQNVRSTVYATTRCPSVRPSVCPSAAAEEQLDTVRSQVARDRSTALSNRYGQCHAYSQVTRPNTDLLQLYNKHSTTSFSLSVHKLSVYSAIVSLAKCTRVIGVPHCVYRSTCEILLS